MLETLDDYDYDTETKTLIRIWDKDVDIYLKKKYRLDTKTRKLFFLIMGQLTDALT